MRRPRSGSYGRHDLTPTYPSQVGVKSCQAVTNRPSHRPTSRQQRGSGWSGGRNCRGAADRAASCRPLLAWFTWPDGTSTEPTNATTNNVHTDDHYGDSVIRVIRAIARRHPQRGGQYPVAQRSRQRQRPRNCRSPHYPGHGATLPRTWRDTALVIATVSLPGMKRPFQSFVKQNSW
jgi:hypothetical protein